ncbi:MAG: hypothetical protein RL026_1493 [Pseudomonadota bacterium]
MDTTCPVGPGVRRGVLLSVVALALLGNAKAAPANAPADICRRLCGQWEADSLQPRSAVDPVEEALANYRDRDTPLFLRSHDAAGTPPHGARGTEPTSDGSTESDPAAEPIVPPEEEYADLVGQRRRGGPWRPSRAELRADLQPLARLPERVEIRWADGTMTLSNDSSTQTLRPGGSHSRVDSSGTASIDAKWSKGRFIVRENYGRGWRNTDIYRYDDRGASLVLERRLERPGVDDIVIQCSYKAKR